MKDLLQGRESYRRRAWGDAYASLSIADRTSPLQVEDLELLATSAYLTGRDMDFQRLLDRAHHAHLKAGDRARAARSAFWLALSLFLRGEAGQGSGWLARAQRVIEDHDCVEHGYLRLLLTEQQLAEGKNDDAHATATGAVDIGGRFEDPDLIACARHLQGRALIRQGQIRTGIVLLDEAMLSATTGELSPIMTGLIYCSLIEVCQDVYALSRAREWTEALARWCESQPQMVAFTATCLVHRAKVLALSGAWSDAMAEARSACERFSGRDDRSPPASAFYEQAELDRLRGNFASAEESYLEAGRLGLEPQPGLALLRLAQGRSDAACAAMRRVLGAVTDPLRRARYLPAFIEIMLATGNVREARDAGLELEKTAATLETDVLDALAAQARGAIELADGNAREALRPLRRAAETWRQVDAPYEAARVRVLAGLACRALGDDDAGGVELGAARAVFERLGAAPELRRLDSLEKENKPSHETVLTSRELQVLRLIAAGKTNKAIATELFLSERTIDRHVSNILNKLDVPSRAAATAYAYGHKLL